MIEKSNFQMIKDFGDFKPEKFGLLKPNEVVKIKRHFQIDERTDMELQNLRDFVVLFFSNLHTREEDHIGYLDIMSAIVGVIDDEKINRGMEV